MRILKVFADEQHRDSILDKATLVEPYEAFLVVRSTPAVARALARTYPTEDITTQFELELPEAPAAGMKTLKAATRAAAPAPRSAKPSSGPHHYVVQFHGPIKASWLTKVRGVGAQVRTPLGAFSYVVRATGAVVKKLEALPFVRLVRHLPHAARVGRGVEAGTPDGPTLPRRRVRANVYRVEVFDQSNTNGVATGARKLGFAVLSKDPAARILVLETKTPLSRRAPLIRKLSAVHGVKFIRQQVVPRTTNNVATGIMGNPSSSIQSGGVMLDGTGEIVAVCDTGLDSGDPASIHPDFANRIVAIKSYPIAADWSSIITNPGANDGPADLDSGHGTHVAGSVAGDGTAAASTTAVIRGHAHKAKLVFQAVEQEMKWKPNAPANLRTQRFVLAGLPLDLAPLFQFAFSRGARIHSNSWGGGDPGAYDDQCRQFDQFVWTHKDFCFVIAAGNDGTDADGNGSVNLGSVTSPGTAKNCITVGASENLRPEFDAERYGTWWPTDFPASPIAADPMANAPDQVVAFSSRGPTRDRRCKPDVVAPGTFILSTRSSRLAPNNFAWAAYPPDKRNYFHMGGTSMATPLTAGAVALLRQFLRLKRGIANPTAALVKALLIAGAERVAGTAPAGALLDNHQGFGRVNVARSVKQVLATLDGPGMRTGQRLGHRIRVPAGQKTVRFVLCFTDFPGTTLINNLNLMVTSPSGRTFVGNQPASGGATLTFDATNNVEVVEVRKPAAGDWTLDVLASNVSRGPQDFALAAVVV